MMTRGTRGDVQPFVALARGLAEQLGWLVAWTPPSFRSHEPLLHRREHQLRLSSLQGHNLHGTEPSSLRKKALGLTA